MDWLTILLVIVGIISTIFVLYQFGVIDIPEVVGLISFLGSLTGLMAKLGYLKSDNDHDKDRANDKPQGAKATTDVEDAQNDIDKEVDNASDDEVFNSLHNHLDSYNPDSGPSE